MTPRRARPDDHDALMALIEEFCLADRHAFDPDRVSAALTPLLASDDHGLVLLLDGADGARGYGVLTWGWSLESGGRESLVDELFVAPQGFGHGAVLLAAMVEAAREHGARTVFLETEEHNERVRGFYARNGFTQERSTWMSRTLMP